jgi:hypothetical protein
MELYLPVLNQHQSGGNSCFLTYTRGRCRSVQATNWAVEELGLDFRYSRRRVSAVGIATAGWTIRGANPVPREALASTQLPVQWIPQLFPGVKQPGRDNFRLVPRLEISGAVPLFPLFAFVPWTGIPLPVYLSSVTALKICSALYPAGLLLRE